MDSRRVVAAVISRLCVSFRFMLLFHALVVLLVVDWYCNASSLELAPDAQFDPSQHSAALRSSNVQVVSKLWIPPDLLQRNREKKGTKHRTQSRSASGEDRTTVLMQTKTGLSTSSTSLQNRFQAFQNNHHDATLDDSLTLLLLSFQMLSSDQRRGPDAAADVLETAELAPRQLGTQHPDGEQKHLRHVPTKTGRQSGDDILPDNGRTREMVIRRLETQMPKMYFDQLPLEFYTDDVVYVNPLAVTPGKEQFELVMQQLRRLVKITASVGWIEFTNVRFSDDFIVQMDWETVLCSKLFKGLCIYWSGNNVDELTADLYSYRHTVHWNTPVPFFFFWYQVWKLAASGITDSSNPTQPS